MPTQDVRIVDFEPNGDHFAVALGATVYELPRANLVQRPDTDAVVVQAQVEDIYYTLDGSDPNPDATPPHGFLISSGGLAAGGVEVRIQITNFNDNKRPKFKRAAAGAVLQVQPVTQVRRPT